MEIPIIILINSKPYVRTYGHQSYNLFALGPVNFKCTDAFYKVTMASTIIA